MFNGFARFSSTRTLVLLIKQARCVFSVTELGFSTFLIKLVTQQIAFITIDYVTKKLIFISEMQCSSFRYCKVFRKSRVFLLVEIDIFSSLLCLKRCIINSGSGSIVMNLTCIIIVHVL